MTDRELCALAIKAMNNSYSPYSDYRVGAALMSEAGKVYTGCNIENSAFSPTCCAERVAFFKAISEGERSFLKIAIAGGKKGEALNETISPCGVCRQVMAEFCKPDFKILLVKSENEYTETTLAQLLPLAFSGDNIK